MPLYKTSNLNSVQMSKLVQIEMYNLQTQLVQFKEQKKLKPN